MSSTIIPSEYCSPAESILGCSTDELNSGRIVDILTDICSSLPNLASTSACIAFSVDGTVGSDTGPPMSSAIIPSEYFVPAESIVDGLTTDGITTERTTKLLLRPYTNHQATTSMQSPSFPETLVAHGTTAAGFT